MIHYNGQVLEIELGPGDGADTALEVAVDLAPVSWKDFTISRCERGWVFSDFNSYAVEIVEDERDEHGVVHRHVLSDGRGDISKIVEKYVGSELSSIHVSRYDDDPDD